MELAREWAELCAVSMDDFEKIYAMLDVKIDLLLGESFYQSRMPGVIARCLEKYRGEKRRRLGSSEFCR